MLRRRLDASSWIVLACFVLLGWPTGPANATQLDEAVGWDVLPNGLIEVQYDRSGDSVPDHVTLHQIIWSGWTAQPIQEIEAQARLESQWIFVVEYDQDRFVYLTKSVPLFWADDPTQRGDWTVLPAEFQGEPLTDGISTCPVCGQ